MKWRGRQPQERVLDGHTAGVARSIGTIMKVGDSIAKMARGCKGCDWVTAIFLTGSVEVLKGPDVVN